MNTRPLFIVPNAWLSWMRRYPGLEKGPHSRTDWYLEKGPLRHGTTRYVLDVDPFTKDPEQFKVVTVHDDQECLNALRAQFNELPVKLYYHELAPGQHIDVHTDTLPYFGKVRRLQFTMDKPQGFVVEQFDSELRPWYVHEFNPKAPHGYYNNSTLPVGFFVCDFALPEHQSEFLR